VATRQTAGTRAKDSDRNDTCQILDSALADGQLSMEEHRGRVASATTAQTLGDLQTLISDLQTANAPVQLPHLKRASPFTAGPAPARAGWGLRAAVASALVVLGIAIGWGLYGNTSSPLSFQPDPGAMDSRADGIEAKVLTPPRQLHSLGGLTGLFEQKRVKFGDTSGYTLSIYDDMANLERSDPNEPRRALRYTYRGGWDDPSETSMGSDARVVDLAQFDIPMLVGVIRGAPETLGINPDEVETLYVNIEPNRDMTAPPGSVEISVYVSPEFGNSGSIYLNGDGSIKRVSPPST
jgi:hypothetical protein